jgi:hypothetical protein
VGRKAEQEALGWEGETSWSKTRCGSLSTTNVCDRTTTLSHLSPASRPHYWLPRPLYLVLELSHLGVWLPVIAANLHLGPRFTC